MGDSRAYLAKFDGKHKAISLTYSDHHVMNPHERYRVTAAGAKFDFEGYISDGINSLAPTRAFGDRSFVNLGVSNLLKKIE